MESSDMKNMVVLKNLPSNMVEEAIIILKKNPKFANIKTCNKTNENVKESKEYVIKEAEMLINDYIKKVEENKESKNNIRKKYKFLKRYSICATIILFISLIINLI